MDNEPSGIVDLISLIERKADELSRTATQLEVLAEKLLGAAQVLTAFAGLDGPALPKPLVPFKPHLIRPQWRRR